MLLTRKLLTTTRPVLKRTCRVALLHRCIHLPKVPRALRCLISQYTFNQQRTEYWKSNARKYCDMCKCWMADNKISISYHETGKKHKENVSKRLSELSKKSIKEHRSQKRDDADMRKMEVAALAAYMKDVENNADLMSQSIKKTLDEANSVLTLEAANETSSGERSGKSDPASEQPITWNEVVSEDGSKYYWNTETNATTWEEPDRFFTVEEQEKKKKKEFRKKKCQEDHKIKVKHEENSKELDAHLMREKMKELRPKAEPQPERPMGPAMRPENPLGVWVPVITKPPEKIDLQLPKQEFVAVTVIKDEPNKRFKEKQIISLSDSSESTEFKKRKFGGIKNKNSRRRLDDDG